MSKLLFSIQFYFLVIYIVKLNKNDPTELAKFHISKKGALSSVAMLEAQLKQKSL